MDEVDGLRSTLKERGTDEQRQVIQTLVDHAAPILDRIIETFPTYTLHNSTHARNVAGLMAKLLGERLQDLTPLEAAFLILAAYWHDIGMVFRGDERTRLTEEPEWPDFLQSHAGAYLAVNGDPKAEPPPEIGEWYCRWRHADRVFVYLNAAAAQGLNFKWGVVDLREALGNLCRSHNEGIDRIQANAVLKTDFLTQADLRFCAIILRLADILDFDRTRSPDSVYRYLGLKRRADPRQKASDVEWQKHLAADGFVFPEDRSPGYVLDFIAGPDHPAVEYDLRQFLEVIEGEIEQCKALLSTCSKRWREFVLPARIRRESIIASGYRYGEYRFSLDQHQVLDLLMGENLYDSSFVFVREVLQNALDASRLREHLERLRGDKDFKAQPIRVSEWLDRDRDRWVRFDDFGTGMDEQIVRDHLLKVGSSYYTSAQYEADKLRASKGVGSDFVPISRFGIGLLSCFISGDQIEISTLRQLPDGARAAPVRLSLNGMHSFYVLQTPDLPPNPMPCRDGDELSYRNEFGTSIAIRMDRSKERAPLDLRAVLDAFLLCPPVPVELDGERIGGDPQGLLETTWCEAPTTTLTEEEAKCILGALPEPQGLNALQFEIIPLDITKYSPSSSLRGQLVLILLGREFRSVLKEAGFAYEIEPVYKVDSINDHGLKLTPQHDAMTSPTKYSQDTWSTQLERLPWRSRDIVIPSERLMAGLAAIPSELFRQETDPRLAHNGISIPTRSTVANAGPRSFDFKFFGILSLTDSLRPVLSTSRDVVLLISWNITSAISITVLRALTAQWKYLQDLTADWNYSGRCENVMLDAYLPQLIDLILPYRREEVTLATIMEDPLFGPEGPWAKEPFLKTSQGVKSLEQICAAVTGEDPIELTIRLPPRTSIEKVAAGLVHRYLEMRLLCMEKLKYGEVLARFRISGARRVPIEEGEKLFEPLHLVPFGHDRALRGHARIMNREHLFSIWFLDVAPTLSKRYPGIFEQIHSTILDWKYWEDRLESVPPTINGVNLALDRLAELSAEMRPPKNVYLKLSDFSDNMEIAP